MTFAQALVLLEQGECLQRSGWNGRGMFVFLITGWSPQATYPFRIETMPFLAIRTAEGSLVPWTPSQADVLAHDWAFVGEVLT